MLLLINVLFILQSIYKKKTVDFSRRGGGDVRGTWGGWIQPLFIQVVVCFLLLVNGVLSSSRGGGSLVKLKLANADHLWLTSLYF